MAQFNIAEAKAHFSALVQRVLMGEEVIIARDSKPLVRLVPMREEKGARQPGTARGAVWLAPDFDETPEDFGEYV
jgi:prevent-host-death family protein